MNFNEIGLKDLVLDFDSNDLQDITIVQGDTKTRGFKVLVSTNNGEIIKASSQYEMRLYGINSNYPDKSFFTKGTIDGDFYKVYISTDMASKSGKLQLQLALFEGKNALIQSRIKEVDVYRSIANGGNVGKDLVVDFGKLNNALEIAEKQQKKFEESLVRQEAVESQIAEKHKEVVQIRDGLKDVLTTENARIEAEKKRVSAENTRVSQESTRQSNENTRQSNENARQQNESTRTSNETERQQNESTRKSNENVRQAEESTRKSNEQKRISAETDRSDAERNRIALERQRESNEDERINAENLRKLDNAAYEKNEEQRQAQENTRQSNESTRKSNENVRQAEESTRQAEESTRKSEEQKRISAESSRNSEETKRDNAEKIRIENENKRISAENKRAENDTQYNKNEEQRQQNEATRQTQEQQRVEAEKLRQSQETTRKQFEDTRASQENTRQSQEQSRVDAESKRAASETTREESEQARSTKETERQNAEQTRQSNENTRQQQESDRVEAEKQRAKAESDRAGKFEGWDKTMQGVIPMATSTVAGIVRIDVDGESTAASVKTLEETADGLSRVFEEAVGTKAEKGHTHTTADVTDLETVLSSKASKEDINKLSTELTEKVNSFSVAPATSEKAGTVKMDRDGESVAISQKTYHELCDDFSELLGRKVDADFVNSLQSTVDENTAGIKKANESLSNQEKSIGELNTKVNANITEISNTKNIANANSNSISGLVNAFNKKADKADLDNKADKKHTHSISDISNLQYTLNNKASASDLSSLEAKINNLSNDSVRNKNGGSLSFWAGTQSEYDRIYSKDINTIYFITE